MALELTGIEISADVATAISAISAYIGWQAGRNKEKREAEEKQKKHDMEIIINRLTPLVVLARDFNFTDPKLMPKVQEALFDFQSESVSCSSYAFECVTNANLDFNYVLKNDQTDRGLTFILYSLINLIFELYSFMQGEDRAKKYLRSVFQTNQNIDEIIKSYKEYRKEKNIS